MENGTVIWFKNTYGYIGRGMYTNASYEGQIYVHYKNIIRKGLRNPGYRELKPNDVVEFVEGTGFYCDGTQAMKVRAIYLAPDNDERHEVSDIQSGVEKLVHDGMEKRNSEDSGKPVKENKEKPEVRKKRSRTDETSETSDDGQSDTMGGSRQEDKE